MWGQGGRVELGGHSDGENLGLGREECEAPLGGEMQVQEVEGLCGVESGIFLQRQLSPRNMVEAGVNVEMFTYSQPAPDAVSCQPPPRRSPPLEDVKKKNPAGEPYFLALPLETLGFMGFPQPPSPNSQIPVQLNSVGEPD